MGISDVSMFVKVSMILGIVAFLFDLIGFVSPYWFTASGEDYSSSMLLWQTCASNSVNSACVTIPSHASSSELKAGQALNVLGFLAGGAAVVLIILYIFVLTAKKQARLFGIIAAFVAAGLILIGIIIVGTSDYSKLGYDVGWAMILTIIGALLYIATGVLMVVDVVQNKSTTLRT